MRPRGEAGVRRGARPPHSQLTTTCAIGQVCYGGAPVGIKRLLLPALLALVSALVVVAVAAAGDIADAPCPDASGTDTATCPAGTEGVPYSITFKLKEGSGCAPGDDSWSVSSGSFPPGLSLSSSGTVSGTPTQAGSFTFYVTVSFPVYPGCNGGFSDKKITIPINPGVPRLILQPEQTGVPVGTVGTAYSLPMTSNLSELKTFAISAGTLPPGLAIGASDGVISGMPTTAGTYTFTVLAAINGDPHQRSDTKTLAITVRNAVTIAAPATALPASEVGVPFELELSASGGTETFTWTALGRLPTGVTLADGVLSGTPRRAGTFAFSVNATDGEGRTAAYAGRLVVAPRLRVPRQPLGPARQGAAYRSNTLRTIGGVLPQRWRLLNGRLPLGVRFAPKLGMFIGKPRKAGRYRIAVEATDALDVTAKRSFVIVVRPAPALKAKKKNR